MINTSRMYTLGNLRHFDGSYKIAHKCLDRFKVSTGIHPADVGIICYLIYSLIRITERKMER